MSGYLQDQRQLKGSCITPSMGDGSQKMESWSSGTSTGQSMGSLPVHTSLGKKRPCKLQGLLRLVSCSLPSLNIFPPEWDVLI